MDDLFVHTPDINDEDGSEYPWSIVLRDIKSRKNEWDEIKQQLNKKKIGGEQSRQFIGNMINALAHFKTEHFLHRDHDKYDNKEQLLYDLKRIREDISAVQKHFWHSEYHDVLCAHLSSLVDADEFSFEDGEHKTAEALQNIEDSLQQMWHASEKALKKYMEKKELRPDFSTFKKNLKYSLASYIAGELYKIGIRPTETRNGVFDKIFQLCCAIADGANLSTKAGSPQVTGVAKKYKKNTKSLPRK